VPWFQVGTADADLILGGEWWRTITALTLHADLAHVLGNAFFFAIFGTAVCRSLGPGLGSCLMLASGVLGNAITAVIQGPLHSSVGASTAIFGAIGVLAGVQIARWRRPQSGRRTRWLPLAAALGLLAMIGMSERADLAAHASGLVAGIPLGFVFGAMRRRLPGVTLQRLLLVGAAGLVSLAWALALS
jgi:rhomboid protease GluP